MKLLGIDTGTKRIGLALGDTESKTAVPWQTLKGMNQESLAVEIAWIVAEEGIEAVVVGEPIQLSGQRGESAVRARAFGRDLAKHIGPVPIHFIDERLTSRLADRLSAEQDGDRDSISASLILQTYLDRL